MTVGQTNLKHALERKYSLMAGELKEKEGEVARVQSLFETLSTLNRRSERLRHLLSCAEELLKEIDPAWAPARARPVVPGRSCQAGRARPVVPGRSCRTFTRHRCRWARSPRGR